ncbi:hypothetical protein DDB_G0270630 [Dictyostelium discoideum AX4]|uniref:Uncharacterized protein n=1 Tax=Dictyostelium discoideum TaxID=44689 RepID=Q55D88_DICDI|nr:hypothetical protein DDB_G0270630 [Dictyostelium discoideum AX4]EAL72665.1 hypothetical protein DDB_G0270630 [Dictyostelium discoideum AX4]|eukprot:XP_646243.1 hypothetical protein DDB_G0270630 [Dictyostelium discoideum AX4]
MNTYYHNLLECAKEISEHVSSKHVIDKENFDMLETFLFYNDIISQLNCWNSSYPYFYSKLNDHLIEQITKEWFLGRFHGIKGLNYILLDIINNKNEYINRYATVADKQLVFNNFNFISNLIQQLTTQLITGYYNKILELKFNKISSKYKLNINFNKIYKIPIHVIDPFTSYTHLIKDWRNQAVFKFLTIYNDLNVEKKEKLIILFKNIKRNLLKIHKNKILGSDFLL